MRIAEQQLEMVRDNREFREGIAEVIRALALEQKRQAEQQTLLTEEQRRLAEAQRHTEERMTALIDIVDGMIRNRGQSQPG